jgi:hypothetical protein
VFVLFNLGLQEIIILLMVPVLGFVSAGIIFAVLFATGALGKKQRPPEEET